MSIVAKLVGACILTAVTVGVVHAVVPSAPRTQGEAAPPAMQTAPTPTPESSPMIAAPSEAPSAVVAPSAETTKPPVVRSANRHERTRGPVGAGSVAAPTTGATAAASARDVGLDDKQATTAKPGETFAYKNMHYLALGVIAEKVTGKDFASLIRERVSKKVSATATFFESEDEISGTIAPVRTAQGQPGDYAFPATATWGAGNLVAPPEDALKWIEAFGSGRFLDAKTDTAMRDALMPVEGPATYAIRYGLGIMELIPGTTFGGGPGYGHFGDLISGGGLKAYVGYHTAAFYFPERKTTVVTVLDYTPLTDLNGSHESQATLIKSPFYAVLKTLFGPN